MCSVDKVVLCSYCREDPHWCDEMDAMVKDINIVQPGDICSHFECCEDYEEDPENCDIIMCRRHYEEYDGICEECRE